MAFMEPEIYHGTAWCVETETGCYYVPTDVEPDGRGEQLAQYAPEGLLCANPTIICVTRVTGWLGRLSAPGYLDCTDWCMFDSEQDAIDALSDEDDGDDEEDEE